MEKGHGMHNCAVLRDGTAKCWGKNDQGQLGIGIIFLGENIKIPYTVLDLEDTLSISAGSGHSCALLSNGQVKCWGDNQYGELGDGTTTDRSTPVLVSGLNEVISLSLGAEHSCAVLKDGRVKCWGKNNYGQLGDGTTTNRSTPVLVSGLTDVVSISLGGNHSCALLKDRRVKCWGRNSFGQLGDGTTTNRSTPVLVSGLDQVLSLSLGADHSCALLENGTVKCWGKNGYGQLGDGTTTNRSTPVLVSGLTDVVSIKAGSSNSYYEFYGYRITHNCALLRDGRVKCWGGNHFGQLGDGTDENYRLVPIFVLDSTGTPLSGVDQITVGLGYSCALLNDTRIKCWGDNSFGQLGNGEELPKRLTPVEIY
jgi:alpha-tubulin suppressor-like RCC1 family protein